MYFQVKMWPVATDRVSWLLWHMLVTAVSPAEMIKMPICEIDIANNDDDSRF